MQPVCDCQFSCSQRRWGAVTGSVGPSLNSVGVNTENVYEHKQGGDNTAFVLIRSMKNVTGFLYIYQGKQLLPLLFYFVFPR